jgi:hypothetical protein
MVPAARTSTGVASAAWQVYAGDRHSERTFHALHNAGSTCRRGPLDAFLDVVAALRIAVRRHATDSGRLPNGKSSCATFDASLGEVPSET